MKKVYIVDDDRDMVEAMTMVLRKNNYDVVWQYDEERLEENLAQQKPDLIILDVMFPEDPSGGFAMARRLKANKDLAHIPLLMLSAINEKGRIMGGFSDKDIDETWLPVNVFLEKPASPTALVARVRALIGS
jgi:DNA-binding response OmpR family regulator